jgi:hypothetical protein
MDKTLIIKKTLTQRIGKYAKNFKIFKSEISFLIQVFTLITNRDYILIHFELFTQRSK